MSLLEGLAELLAIRGHGVWRPTGKYTDPEVGIVLETVPQAPAQLISLWAYGGVEADARNAIDEPSVQVRVRGNSDPRISRDLAQSIYDELHGDAHFALPDGTWVESVIGINAGPTHLGQDGNSRHEHVVSFRFEINNPASVTRA
jgi:hypothetical protein